MILNLDRKPYLASGMRRGGGPICLVFSNKADRRPLRITELLYCCFVRNTAKLSLSGSSPIPNHFVQGSLVGRNYSFHIILPMP